MARHYDVITVGEATIDAYMTIHDTAARVHFDSEEKELHFKHGEKINVERYDFSIGGNATNVAVGVSRLGLRAALCAETGDDEFSIKIRNTLATENIERVLVNQTHGASNFSVIINFKKDRTIFVQDAHRGHNFDFDEVSAKYVYLTSLGYDWEAAYLKTLDFAIENKSIIVFNPGHLQLQHGKEIIHKVLKSTDFLFVNKEEAELILFNHYNKKIDNSDRYEKELCEELQRLGAKTVVLTNGKYGSAALSESGDFYTEDLYPGVVVERTGAGDGFASGFLAATVGGMDLKTSMKWGSINAASVVGKIGAQAGLLTKDQMEEKL